ncbi:MAG: iron-containing alcohol dehydrogenase [Pseudomonadota bacterium]
MLSWFRNTVFRYIYATLIKIYPPRPPVLFNQEKATPALCREMATKGSRRVLVITSKDLIKLGLLDTFFSALQDIKVQVEVFDGIQPNPTFDAVEAATIRYKEKQCDAVLAFGGGSVIDAAKAVILHVDNKRPLRHLIGIFKAGHQPVPFYVIPTTAGTGSEITSTAVLSDPTTHQKFFLTDHKMLPLAVALDPSVMTGLPPAITADTGMDALTHAIESHISKIDNPDKMALAANAVAAIFNHLPQAYANGANIEARAEMANASYNAGMAFNAMGLGFVHAISHQLTALYGIPHGRANAIVLPYVLRASLPQITKPLARLARESGISKNTHEVTAAQQLLEGIDALSSSLNMAKGINELEAKDFDEIATRARKEAISTYPFPYMLSHQACVEILQKLKQNGTRYALDSAA